MSRGQRPTVGNRGIRVSRNRKYRTKGGSWAFVIARVLLPDAPDPETFTHDEIAEIIQAIERIDLNVNVTAIRYEMEWIVWDRDGWQHIDRDRHVKKVPPERNRKRLAAA